MARGRLISKSLGSSRKFHELLGAGGKLGEFCQVLFPLIVANTDDFGRMAGDAFTVKHVVLPSSRRAEKDFEQALDAIARAGLVDRYTVEGRIYLQVQNFDAHQPNLHKRTESRCPESPGMSGSYRPNLTQSNLTEFKRTQNPEENPEPRTAVRTADGLFEQFWAAYPRKKSKDDARRAWDKRHPTQELTATILEAIQRQQESSDWRREGGRWIPHPATWLNGARWTDGVDVDGGLSDTGVQNASVMARVAARYQEKP